MNRLDWHEETTEGHKSIVTFVLFLFAAPEILWHDILNEKRKGIYRQIEFNSVTLNEPFLALFGDDAAVCISLDNYDSRYNPFTFWVKCGIKRLYLELIFLLYTYRFRFLGWFGKRACTRRFFGCRNRSMIFPRFRMYIVNVSIVMAPRNRGVKSTFTVQTILPLAAKKLLFMSLAMHWLPLTHRLSRTFGKRTLYW